MLFSIGQLVATPGALRVFSSYKIGSDKIYVITEANRSSTCVLLPEEY